MLPDFRVRQRDFLLEISRAITAQLDLGEVLRRVLNASVVMLAGQMGLIALREADSQYHIRAILGMDSTRLPQLNELLRDLISGAEEGLDPKALDAKMKVILAAIDPRLRQYVALPLTFADEPLGLLIIFRAYQGSATADDIQVLQSFADQASIAVHNAQLYERIDQERKRLGAIVQYGADGVMILDAGLKIMMFNRALERMTGWTGAEAIGLDQDEVITWKKLDMPDLTRALAAGWPSAREDDTPDTLYVEGDLKRKDGLTLSIGITYAPLLTRDGHVASIIANVRDITHFRKAQEMQSVFISTISHELKTPVAIIKGYAGTLSRPDADWNPEVIRDGLQVIEEESDRLTSLIENLLAASKIQAQRGMELNLSDVRLDQLAGRAVERFLPQLTKHKIKLHFPADFPAVPGDELKLRQVLDNLLSNAIKYSPEGGMIDVGGSSSDDQITVYIKDPGVGLSESDREHLFERFYRVDSALSRKTQGTGLGLYLSKAIVEAHGGEMLVESQPGKGATFSFTLPL